MLKNQVQEERYPYLNEEENFIIEDSGQDHWRDVAEDGDNKQKIHTLRREVYIKEKEELIKVKFSVSVTHLKGGDIFWIFVKDNITKEKELYKAIGLPWFDYKILEEQEGGGV